MMTFQSILLLLVLTCTGNIDAAFPKKIHLKQPVAVREAILYGNGIIVNDAKTNVILIVKQDTIYKILEPSFTITSISIVADTLLYLGKKDMDVYIGKYHLLGGYTIQKKKIEMSDVSGFPRLIKNRYVAIPVSDGLKIQPLFEKGEHHYLPNKQIGICHQIASIENTILILADIVSSPKLSIFDDGETSYFEMPFKMDSKNFAAILNKDTVFISTVVDSYTIVKMFKKNEYCKNVKKTKGKYMLYDIRGSKALFFRKNLFIVEKISELR